MSLFKKPDMSKKRPRRKRNRHTCQDPAGPDSPTSPMQTDDFSQSRDGPSTSPTLVPPAQIFGVGAVPPRSATFVPAPLSSVVTSFARQLPEQVVGNGTKDAGFGSTRPESVQRGSIVHPARAALIASASQKPGFKAPSAKAENEVTTPKMSPGILAQTHPKGVNPFRTSLGDSSNNRSNPNTTPIAARSKKVQVEPEEPLPELKYAAAPDRSKIVVARQYLFQHECEAAGLGDERDVSKRLSEVGLIEGVRRALRMPIKTFGTACVFYHRYRYHVATSDEIDAKNDYRMAALACLWLASKAEETPKKSKEILCAAWNLTLPVEDHLTPDDEAFENQSKVMITLERTLLEIVAFDFRARNSADVLAGLCHETNTDKATGTAALAIYLDVHRTLAVLKQTRQTLACACLELAARFLDKDASGMVTQELYEKLGASRGEVAETIRDLIDLYMNHQPQTVAGPRFNLNDFMRVSISITTEMREKSLPRYTYYHAPSAQKLAATTTSPTTSPQHDQKSTPTIQYTPRTPSSGLNERKPGTNGQIPAQDLDLGDPKSPPPEYLLQQAAAADSSMLSASPTSPTSPIDPPNPDDPSQIAGVVRFVLDASRAHDEKLTIAPYYDIVEEEITEEKEVWIPKHSRREENNNINHTSTSRNSGAPTHRIHGGFLARGSGSANNDDPPPRRTYTPPPSSNYARGRTPPPRREYRRDTSPRGGGYRRGDDRREGYRRDDRREERRRDY